MMIIKRIGLSVLCGFLLNCDPECLFKDLSSMECEGSYNMVAGGRAGSVKTYIQEYYTRNKTPKGQIFIINDDSTYHANYGTQFGTVDFAINSIIGVTVRTNPGSGFLSQGFLCKYSAAANKWMYTVEYSLNRQCAGSHSNPMNLTASLLCPKLTNNPDIELRIVDINPR